MTWDYEVLDATYDRLALGFIAYYKKVGLDKIAVDMADIFHDGENSIVATEGIWICDNKGLPVPSDLADEFTRLFESDPEYYREEAETLKELERTDPILPSLPPVRA